MSDEEWFSVETRQSLDDIVLEFQKRMEQATDEKWCVKWFNNGPSLYFSFLCGWWRHGNYTDFTKIERVYGNVDFYVDALTDSMINLYREGRDAPSYIATSAMEDKNKAEYIFCIKERLESE